MVESSSPARSYSLVRGPSGSGKSRAAIERVWGENQRYSIVEAMKAGAPLRFSPSLFEHLDTGAARPAFLVTTRAPFSSHETVASYLSLDKKLFAYVSTTERRFCPYCRFEYARIRDPQATMECLRRNSVDKIDLHVRVSEPVAAETLRSLGFSADTANTFTIDTGVELAIDSRRIESALSTAFGIRGGLIIVSAHSSRKRFFFSPSGACLSCGAIEPPLKSECLDFRMNVAEFEGIPTFRHTRGYTKAENDLRTWLSQQPFEGKKVEEVVGARICDLPDHKLFERTKILLSDLDLGNLHFLRICNDLSTSELTRLRIVSGLLNSDSGGLLVIDGATLGLDKNLVRRLLPLLQVEGTVRQLVVIDNHWEFSGCVEGEDLRAADVLQNSILQDTPGTLSVVSGPSGKGKTTWIRQESKKFDNPTEFIRLSAANNLSDDTLVSELLRLDEPLSQLFASSVDARSAGIEAVRFRRRNRTKLNDYCFNCRGTGIEFASLTPQKNEVTPLKVCTECGGLRVFGDLAKVRYKSLTLCEFWKLPLAKVTQLLKNLTKFQAYIKGVSQLGLDEIHFGSPLGACSEGERYRLLLLQSTCEAKSITTFILEHPTWRLGERQKKGLEEYVQGVCAAGHSVVVESQDWAGKVDRRIWID